MKYKLSFLSLLFPLLLLVSGQAFAVSCTTAAAGALDTMAVWGGTAAGATDCATPAAWKMSTAADDITIKHALAAPSGNVAAKTVTIDTTGGLTLGGNTLTISGSFTNNATPATAVVLTGSTVVFATPATPTIGGTASTAFNILTINDNTTLATAGSTAGLLTVAAGKTLTLNADLTASGGVTFGGTGTVAGTGALKIANADTDITVTTAATIAKLDVSAVDNKTITVKTNGLKITSVVAPAESKIVKFALDTAGKTLEFTNGTGNMSCSYDGTATKWTGKILTVEAGKILTCTGLATAVPIFSTKEKPAVFVEEVNR